MVGVRLVEWKLDGLNIEVTNCCPLHCPQCYCTLEGGKHMPLDKAERIIEQAADLGVRHIEFSGGETLCYPYICEIIETASSKGISTGIAISGWGFNSDVLDRLKDVGLDSIYVSLNAATEELNMLSRDGYQYSINALRILNEAKFPNTIINWVMHRNVVNSLPDMIRLAEQYSVSAILILDPKPNSHNELDSYPSFSQLQYVAGMIKSNRSSVQLIPHHCFSVLAAISSENKLWGNLNRGIYKGCTAGLCSISINVDGDFVPCRHLEIPEQFDSLESYWKNSDVLKELRLLHNNKREPCRSCKFEKNCRHCIAGNFKINKELYIGNAYCPVGR